MLEYKLDDLGWDRFEQLVQTLLKVRLGLGVEAWGGSGDWGRDAYFNGKLSYPTNEPLEGAFVFQCKFVDAANAAGAKPERPLLSAVRKECVRIEGNLGDSGNWNVSPTCYGFFTNAVLTPKNRVKINQLLQDVLPGCRTSIHDGHDICQWLRLSPSVFQSFESLGGDTQKLISALIDALPPRVTAQQLHSESCVLAETGNFEQAAVKAEEACNLAVTEGDTRLQWRASLIAARAWLNHGFDTSLSEPARENLVSRVAKNIAVAENAGAPAGELALEKAILASLQHDNEGMIRYATLVASDASCGDAYQAEALAMRLQGLLFAERIDDALLCVEDVEKSRLSTPGEQLLQIEAAWLRILCVAQLATDSDVTNCIECAEQLTEVHPKLRFRALNTVIRQFSRAAQEQAKPAAATLIFERLIKLKRVANESVARVRLLEEFTAHEQKKVANDDFQALKKEYTDLLNSARPQTGNRHTQGIRLLESGYSIMKATDDAPEMADIAARIAEYSAEAGDTAKAELFLGYCDSWIEACKSRANDSQREWCSLRAGALLVRGKSFYRLGCRSLESKTPAERWFVGAHEATTKAMDFASEHREQMHGNTELFLADASYWLAEI